MKPQLRRRLAQHSVQLHTRTATRLPSAIQPLRSLEVGDNLTFFRIMENGNVLLLAVMDHGNVEVQGVIACGMIAPCASACVHRCLAWLSQS